MRGQVSVEYLTTYGWVVIVVLLTLSVLYQFDVFHPGRITRPFCDTGHLLVCKDAYYDSDGQVRLLLVNTLTEKVTLTKLAFQHEDIFDCNLPSIEPASQDEILCFVNTTAGANEPRSIAFQLLFRRNETGAQVYNLTGAVQTKIQKPRLALTVCELLDGDTCGSGQYCTVTALDDDTPQVCCPIPCGPPQCGDGRDNDVDGQTDFPNDPECTDLTTDNDEAS